MKEEVIGFASEITSVSSHPTSTKKYFFVNSRKPHNGLTLTIHSTDADLAQKVMREIKFMLTLIRHLKLKVHWIRLDQNILESMSEHTRNECYLKHPELLYNFYS